MNRTCRTIIAVMFVGACALPAQDANPIRTNRKESWGNIKGLLPRMAEKMPDENYRFKPTPEIQDFGQRMAPVISFNMRACSPVKGEPKNVNLGSIPSQAEIVAAMKEANAEGDVVFDSLTDTDLLRMVDTGRRGQRLKLAVLEHSQEMCGYMAVCLRLKGIVPPSRDRNEQQVAAFPGG